MDGKAVCLSLVREFLYRKNLLGVLSKFDDETGTVGGAPLSTLELIRTLNLASVHQRNVTHGSPFSSVLELLTHYFFIRSRGGARRVEPPALPWGASTAAAASGTAAPAVPEAVAAQEPPPQSSIPLAAPAGGAADAEALLPDAAAPAAVAAEASDSSSESSAVVTAVAATITVVSESVVAAVVPSEPLASVVAEPENPEKASLLPAPTVAVPPVPPSSVPPPAAPPAKLSFFERLALAKAKEEAEAAAAAAAPAAATVSEASEPQHIAANAATKGPEPPQPAISAPASAAPPPAAPGAKLTFFERLALAKAKEQAATAAPGGGDAGTIVIASAAADAAPAAPAASYAFTAPDGRGFNDKAAYRKYMFETFLSISKRSGEKIVKKRGDIAGQPFNLSDLVDCEVLVLDHCDQLQIDRLTNCRVFIAACSESTFIRNCKDCVFTLACKQLRTRDCESCETHLYSKTDPIIEKSYGMAFSPFNGACPHLDVLFRAANLPAGENKWRRLFDFSAGDESLPKPHWSILSETIIRPWTIEEPGETSVNPVRDDSSVAGSASHADPSMMAFDIKTFSQAEAEAVFKKK